MKTDHICGECLHFDTNRCLLTCEERARINCVCTKFESLMRTCEVCGRILPIDSFARKGRGYEKVCKDCRDKESQPTPIAEPQTDTADILELEALYTNNPEEYLVNCLDSELVTELRKRGYEGTLTKTITVEL